MNPIIWLFVVAPAAVLAAVLFVWVYQDSSDKGEAMREQHQLERLEFGRDFAAAWNGERIEAPASAEIEAARAKVIATEARREAQKRERCQRLAALAKDLESTLKGVSATPSDCKE
jgi:hydroxypyruvate isomerase